MSGARLLALLLVLVGNSSITFCQVPVQNAQPPDSAAPLNLGKFSVWVSYRGFTGGHPSLLAGVPGGPLGTYPIRATGVLYTSSFLWGGYVYDGQMTNTIRVNGGTYRSGFQPGVMLPRGIAQNPTDPSVRVYRIRADYATADLRSDAADVFRKPIGSVTDEEIDQVRARYAKDWDEWPWRLGAPFYDRNSNGVRDGGEEPGLAGADMVVWYAMNDLDPTASMNLYYAPPTGIEIQTTLWAYKAESHVLANAIFERHRLIYKGISQTSAGARIDSMYLTKFVDPDLGDAGDDLLGSDSLLQLGYVYNGNFRDLEFSSHSIAVPPAVGYTLLQGPVVAASPDESAIFDFHTRPGRRNLRASSMMAKFTGSAFVEPMYSEAGGRQMYLWMQGFLPNTYGPPTPFRNPDGTPTKWCFSGDPRSGRGAIDGLGTSTWSLIYGDRRFLLSTGPFTMALGDTQEVVWALVGADGGDRLGNTYYLKWFTKYLRDYYPDLEALRTFAAEAPAKEQPVPVEFRLEQNYPNPFNPTTTIGYSIAGFRDQASGFSRVRLVVCDLLGREVAVLVDEQQAPGAYSVTLSASGLSSGMYFYRLQADPYTQTRKMMIIR